MIMADILFDLIIFPLVQIIELVYLFVFRVFHNIGFSIFGVSIAVSVLTLPLYFIAEKLQNTERETQRRLAPKVKKIKAVFKGDEQYLILSTYYKQNNYHPLYSLRSSLGLLIQIPFFIAAYSYLSNLDVLKGMPFYLIADLGAPDAMISVMGEKINLLPVVMTVINCIAGAIYTKNFPVKEKIQLYGMAAVFLILLYNSPAGLVLYWTVNNVFSLIKNSLQKLKNAKRIVYISYAVPSFIFIMYLLILHDGGLVKRIFISIFFLFVIIVPPFLKRSGSGAAKITGHFHRAAFLSTRAFFFSTDTLFVLTGVVITGEIIASSVSEFSFVESYTSPFPFIFYTAVQAAGIFLFWPICIYFLMPKSGRKLFTFIAVIFCVLSIVNYLFVSNYGFLTITLELSNPSGLSADHKLLLYSSLCLIFVTAFFSILILRRHDKILYSIQFIILAACVGLGMITINNIHRGFAEISMDTNESMGGGGGVSIPETFEPMYTLTKTGKNVLVIMLDRGLSDFVPYIFEEKPDLLSAFDGFTFYPNCASFANHTYIGAPPMFGGYEYTPEEINKPSDIPLRTRIEDAVLVQPRLFQDAGYSVTLTDPPYEAIPLAKRFLEYPQIHFYNEADTFYASTWLKLHPDVQLISLSSLLKKTFIRFSLFKITPPVFRQFVYDHAQYLTTNSLRTVIKKDIPNILLDKIGYYAELDFLPEITAITDNASNTFTFIVNPITHDALFLQAPDYIPANIVTNKGDGQFSSNAYYHVNIAAFSLLGEFFNYLQDNGAYDNTRIIIVSDHGGSVQTDENNFILPIGEYRQAFGALLMVKDFNESHTLTSDYTFMTNADVPLLTTTDLIPNAVNPFTGKLLESRKSGKLAIATVPAFEQHPKYQYQIADNEWLYVHDDVFKPENWERVK